LALHSGRSISGMSDGNLSRTERTADVLYTFPPISASLLILRGGRDFLHRVQPILGPGFFGIDSDGNNIALAERVRFFGFFGT